MKSIKGEWWEFTKQHLSGLLMQFIMIAFGISISTLLFYHIKFMMHNVTTCIIELILGEYIQGNDISYMQPFDLDKGSPFDLGTSYKNFEVYFNPPTSCFYRWVGKIKFVTTPRRRKIRTIGA